MFENLLEKFNLKYEDLSTEEIATLTTWVNALQQGSLSTDKLKDFISSMKYSVENELSKVGHDSKQDIYLKARLRNLMLLEAFMSSPEKAKARLDQAIAGIVGKKA